MEPNTDVSQSGSRPGDAIMRRSCLVATLLIAPLALPAEFLKRYRRINAFYDPHLNVHVFHVGVPERTDGIIWVYRYKRRT